MKTTEFTMPEITIYYKDSTAKQNEVAIIVTHYYTTS